MAKYKIKLTNDFGGPSRRRAGVELEPKQEKVVDLSPARAEAIEADRYIDIEPVREKPDPKKRRKSTAKSRKKK